MVMQSIHSGHLTLCGIVSGQLATLRGDRLMRRSESSGGRGEDDYTRSNMANLICRGAVHQGDRLYGFPSALERVSGRENRIGRNKQVNEQCERTS